MLGWYHLGADDILLMGLMRVLFYGGVLLNVLADGGDCMSTAC